VPPESRFLIAPPCANLPSVSRLFALLLVLTLLLPGGIGRLDLCGCEGSGHGVLCGQAEPQPAEAPRSCCSQRPGAETRESREEPCPGCPELDLGDEDRPGVLGATESPDPDRLLALGPLPGATPARVQSARSLAPQWPRPPPGPHRLHLVQQVFLR